MILLCVWCGNDGPHVDKIGKDMGVYECEECKHIEHEPEDIDENPEEKL